MTDLETILSWFQTGDIPTEEEFRQTFSSFRHKNTKIPIEEVDRLESLLNSKINSDDYIKDGKIRADKIEALGLTELIEASEKDISEFAENSDKYEFQQNDFIAIPNEEGNFSLYLFKGGEKRNKSNYLSTAGTNMSSGVDFIPLSGTESGKPLTLPIEYVQGGYTDAAIYGGTLTGGRIGALSFGSDNDVRLSNGYTQGAGTSNMNIVQLNTENIQISSETLTGTDRSEILIYPGVISTYAQNINLVGSNVTIGGLPNAQGDPNFTRQLVQNDNGTLGYEPKVDLSTINLQKVLFNGGYANNNENNSLAFDLDNSTMYFNFRDETGTSVSAMSLNSTGTLFQQSRLLGESRFEMNKASDSITFYVRDSSNFPGSDTGLTVNAKAGLVYYNDYSSKFIDRSLVDKAYVDRTINNAVGGSDGGVWDFVGNVD